MPVELIRRRCSPRVCLAGMLLLWLGATAGCGPAANEAVTPVYDKKTGKLEQLTADRNGDGTIDTRAYMDGIRLKYIEIDRSGRGKPDRWEYYVPGQGAGPGVTIGNAFDKTTVLERAEEANGPDGTITRREFYDHGVIQRVEEDTDFDGRVDKWEVYEGGALVKMDLDLQGRGTPDRRLVYRDGVMDHIEADAKGDGVFVRLAPGKAGGGL